jgi:hypothetical protein
MKLMKFGIEGFRNIGEAGGVMMKAALRTLSDLLAALYDGLLLRAYRVTVGGGTRINGRLLIRGSSASVAIGKRVLINSRCSANPIGGGERTSFWTIGNGKIVVGDDTKISSSAIVAMDSVRIGSHVYIGGGCKIYDTDFH